MSGSAPDASTPSASTATRWARPAARTGSGVSWRSAGGFDQEGDLLGQRYRGGQAVVYGEVRGSRLGADPHAGAEPIEFGQLGRVAAQPAGGEPAEQGGLVRPDPDQLDGSAAEFGLP